MLIGCSPNLTINDLGMPLIFFILGVLIFFLPAEVLLRFDRRTGYSIYKHSSDKETGLKAAGTFYKLFGLAFAGIGLLVGVLELSCIIRAMLAFP